MHVSLQRGEADVESDHENGEKTNRVEQYDPPVPLRDILEQVGIRLASYEPGTKRVICPECLGGSSREVSLSLTIYEDGKNAVWNCFRANCGYSDGTQGILKRDANLLTKPSQNGLVHFGELEKSSDPDSDKADEDEHEHEQRAQRGDTKRGVTFGVPEESDLHELSDNMMKGFQNRGISPATVMRMGIGEMRARPPGAEEWKETLVFPYRKGGKIVNAKFRAPPKTFWQAKGGEKVLYGLDDVTNCDAVVIVEGELDKLALDEVGITHSVSVPDGAPPANSDASAEVSKLDRKFSYLWNSRQQLDRARQIVIAVDNDEPGNRLAQELVRRLGKERCFRAAWPEGCKDASEVLQKKGQKELRAAIESATPWPVQGLCTFHDFYQEVYEYFRMGTQNQEVGFSTGWDSVDELYKVVPGELTLVTGVPNSGKSEWLDALVCNLAHKHGWPMALCSLENKVHEHGRKFLEKIAGKPMLPHPRARQNAQPMDERDFTSAFSWLASHFFLIRHEGDQLPSIDFIMDIARVAVFRHGIRGLVIDPYNELDHRRPESMSETEYVSQMLSKLKTFASHHDCHVWLVAHPRQLHFYKGEPPGLYDVSGSAHFMNKADNGIVIHRRPNQNASSRSEDAAEVRLEKVRNKAAGRKGVTTLLYDRPTGRYFDMEPSDADE